MDSRRVIAAQIRAKERAQRLEQARKKGRVPAKTDASQSHNRGSQMLLPVFTLILFALVGGYWHMFGSPFQFGMSPQVMAGLGFPVADRYVNDRFDLDGVQLGMTPSMVRRMYPAAKVVDGRDGERVLTLSTKRGQMVAWLVDNDKFVEVDGEIFSNERERIYRLRLDEAYADLSEQDLIKMYGRAYGRPLEANCERNQLGDTPRCTYRWWGGDGIELTVIMKRKIDVNGQNYVMLTTIATNTKKSAKHAGQRLRRAAHTKPSAT